MNTEVGQAITAQQAKASLRKSVLGKRDALTEAEREACSYQAVQNLLAVDVPPKSEISLFLPIRSEIDLTAALEPLHREGHRLSLPIVQDRTTILFRRYQPGDQLIDVGFGTLGPAETAEVVDPSVMVIPLSVFDRKGGRLGYGAGHYDRAINRLSDAGRSPLKIGCAFSLQEADDLPLEPHDWALDMIITERETIMCRPVK